MRRPTIHILDNGTRPICCNGPCVCFIAGRMGSCGHKEEFNGEKESTVWTIWTISVDGAFVLHFRDFAWINFQIKG